VWADSAYRSTDIEAKLRTWDLKSRIQRCGARNRPLSERQEAANTARSKVRARVEHVFGHQENAMGRKIVRTIGMARAKFKIGMMNLGYNISRLVQLERVAAAPVGVGCVGGVCVALREMAPSSHAAEKKGPICPHSRTTRQSGDTRSVKNGYYSRCPLIILNTLKSKQNNLELRWDRGCSLTI
jgi:hypothetical protein